MGNHGEFTCCNAKELLHSKKMRITKKRVFMLESILKKRSSFHAGEIFSDIKDEIEIDQATVYRILNSLQQNDLIQKILEFDGIAYFESSCMHFQTHSHFICQNCKEIQCLRELSEEEIKTIKKIGHPFDVEKINLVLRGKCKKCKGNPDD
jgi:Fe2+ or Zn2+ uptake regulation protein